MNTSLAKALFLTGILVLATGCLEARNIKELKEAVGAKEPDIVRTPEAPVVVLTASTATAKAGEVVQFSAEDTLDPQALPLTYLWNLGDGFTSRDARVAHAFQTPGTYVVTLTVTNTAGLHANATRVMTILSGNRAPLAAFDMTDATGATVTSVNVDAAVKLIATPSTDPDHDPITFHWDFGDGITSTKPVETHTYGTPGRYPVTLTVTDSHNNVARITKDLSVNYNGAKSGSVGVTKRVWESTFYTGLAKTLNVTVNLEAKSGTEIFTVEIKNPASTTVANKTITSELGTPGTLTRSIVLRENDILANGAGNWAVVITLKEGLTTDAPVTVKLTQLY